MLVVFRAIQGLTGGGLQPSAQAILTDSFPPEKRGIAMALFGMSVVFAPAIGPTLGGFITDNFSWRWVFLVNVPIGLLLMVLVTQNLKDPEVLRKAQVEKLKAGLKVDYLGFALLAVGLGFLQVVLDKGQQDNWFESHFILTLSIISFLALVAFCFWELRRDDPIVDLHLLADRNFAVANMLMFFLGFILLGTTVLIPIFAQTLMGYTAVDAGQVLSPGGFIIMACMPVLAVLAQKVDSRWLIACGLTISSLALFHLSHLDTLVDYKTLALARVYQGVGLAFLFIPINNAAYANLSPLKSSNAAAIVNLSRNLGSSMGVSFVVTLLSRSAQYHQSIMVAHATPFDHDFQNHLQMLTQNFIAHGAAALQAADQARAVLYSQVVQQATQMAFIDNFRTLGVIFMLLIPTVFLMRKPPLSTGVIEAH
jgi:DHA2 family multidrug resistance protein